MKSFPLIRDLVLFLGGLAGVGHETLLVHAERPTLLILFAAMMGLPAFLRSDEKKESSPPPQQGPPQWYQYPYPPQPPPQGAPSGPPPSEGSPHG